MKFKIIVLITLISLIFVGCGSDNNEIPAGPGDRLAGYTACGSDNNEIPDDFDFIIKYGIEAKNQLNTFEGTFTKDLIAAGTITTKLKLTDMDMQTVYQEMQKIDIFSYPENFAPSSNMFVTPHETYYIKVKSNGRVKEILWKDENLSEDSRAVQLRDTINIIKELIENKPEYRKLPEPEGGYC